MSSPTEEKLVVDHLGYARNLASRYRGRGVGSEDLEQVARLGLVKAARRFEPERGVPFQAFAKPTIVGELKRYFRDKGWGARVPRSVKDVSVRIGPAIQELTASLERPPLPREVAEYLGVHTDDVLTALEARQAYRPGSLDAPGHSRDGSSASVVSTLGGIDPSPAELATDKLAVEQLLARLSERDATIVRLRFYEDLTQGEIAELVGLSQMQVSRLLRSSLARMREASRVD